MPKFRGKVKEFRDGKFLVVQKIVEFRLPPDCDIRGSGERPLSLEEAKMLMTKDTIVEVSYDGSLVSDGDKGTEAMRVSIDKSPDSR